MTEERKRFLKQYTIKRRKEVPWLFTYGRITSRCGKVRLYKNIKCLISAEELKTLWFRDKAYLLKKPSIDRIDSSKDYTLDNCRYIEFMDNAHAGCLARWKKEKTFGFVRPIRNIKFNCKKCKREIIIHCYSQEYCPECKVLVRRGHQKDTYWKAKTIKAKLEKDGL